MSDFQAMFLKEWQELFAIPRRGQGFFAVLLHTPVGRLLIVVGIIILSAAGVGGYNLFSGIGAIWFVYLLPFLFVSIIVVDSFAGERERGTLDTLLASRLPERAIFFGKVAAPVAVATLAMITAALCSKIVILFLFGSRAAVIFPAAFLWAMPFSALLTGVLGAGVGALVSERSASIRNAQQSVAYGGLGVALILMLPINSLSPPVRQHLLSMLLSLSPGLITVLLSVLLAGLDAILIYVALRRFIRTRLFDR